MKRMHEKVYPMLQSHRERMGKKKKNKQECTKNVTVNNRAQE